MTAIKSKQLRILYAAGPGNVIGTYHYWLEGRDDSSQVGITWSGQFYDLSQSLGAKAYVISSHLNREKVTDDDFIIEHRPIPFRQASSLLYHVGMIWYGIHLLISAIRFRANVAVVNDGTTHWFILCLFPLFQIQVIPSLQCVLWRKCAPKRLTVGDLLSRQP